MYVDINIRNIPAFVIIRDIGAGVLIWNSGPLDPQFVMDHTVESAGL